MSPIWIVISSLSLFSTLLFVGLAVWLRRIEKLEEHNLYKLRSVKESIHAALEGDQTGKPVEAFNRVISEMPFPLQTYAADINARTEIENLLAGAITELKKHQKRQTPAV